MDLLKILIFLMFKVSYALSNLRFQGCSLLLKELVSLLWYFDSRLFKNSYNMIQRVKCYIFHSNNEYNFKYVYDFSKEWLTFFEKWIDRIPTWQCILEVCVRALEESHLIMQWPSAMLVYWIGHSNNQYLLTILIPN